MKNIIFLIFIFLIIVSNKSVASPTKKIIQVKMPSSIEKLYFFYRDAAFNDQYFVLYNPNKKDTLVSITVELLSGQVIKHSDIVTILGVPTALNQSFIVTDLDTIRFEMDNNRNLNLKGNNGFFVEDIVNVYFEYPGPNNREFLDENNGFSIAKSIFKSNIVAIEKLNKDGRCNKMEYATLLNIVKADYYYRIISWALENQQLEEIEEDIANLQKDLEDIQMVKSSSLVQLFDVLWQFND